jgi:hypothetical protein
VKTGKISEELGASDTICGSEDNSDHSCEVPVTKLSKVLENINGVKTWLEQQTHNASGTGLKCALNFMYYSHCINIHNIRDSKIR